MKIVIKGFTSQNEVNCANFGWGICASLIVRKKQNMGQNNPLYFWNIPVTVSWTVPKKNIKNKKLRKWAK